MPAETGGFLDFFSMFQVSNKGPHTVDGRSARSAMPGLSNWGAQGNFCEVENELCGHC